MSLSFREQAAIALLGGVQGGPASPTAGDVIRMTQRLADAACAAWGHDEEPFFLSSPGARTIAAGGITQDHFRCKRCGAKETR